MSGKAVTPNTWPGIRDFGSQGSRFQNVIELQSWVFTDIHVPEKIPEVVHNITRWSLLQESAIQAHGFAELITTLTVAVVNSRRGYEAIYSLIDGLKQRKTNIALLDQLAFRLAEACLFRFPGRTNYFLLGLIERQLLDSYVIFKFLKNNGALQPQHLATFYYFGPELLAIKPDWYRREWAYIHKEQQEGDYKWDPEVIRAIVPEFPAELDAVNWNDHKTHRMSGEGPCPFLAAIRVDDADRLSDLIASSSVNQKIQWSIYEQRFPWAWTFPMGDKHVTVECPEILHAIGIFAAEKCFNMFCQMPGDAVNEAKKTCAGAIVAGGKFDMIDDLVQHGVDLTGTLKDAIRFHHATLVSFLIDERKVVPDQDAGNACIMYGNLFALHTLLDPPQDTGRAPFIFGPSQQRQQGGMRGEGQQYDTVYHLCAKFNAIEAFKYLLSKWAPQGKEPGFNPYETSDKSATFLHYGCRFAGYDVVKFWCRHAGNAGLDAVDEFNFNPYHYVFMLGINPRPEPANPKAGYEVRRPMWHYMKRRSTPEYDVEKDETPDI